VALVCLFYEDVRIDLVNSAVKMSKFAELDAMEYFDIYFTVL
jgi:hypothetical protein